MPDLTIEYDGRTWVAEWINDRWHLNAEWLNLEIRPAGSGYPISEMAIQYVPARFDAIGALKVSEAIRHKLITEALIHA